MLWETARVEQIQRLPKRGLWCENKNVLVIHLDGLTIRVKEQFTDSYRHNLPCINL